MRIPRVKQTTPWLCFFLLGATLGSGPFGVNARIDGLNISQTFRNDLRGANTNLNPHSEIPTHPTSQNNTTALFAFSPNTNITPNATYKNIPTHISATDTSNETVQLITDSTNQLYNTSTDSINLENLNNADHTATLIKIRKPKRPKQTYGTKTNVTVIHHKRKLGKIHGLGKVTNLARKQTKINGNALGKLGVGTENSEADVNTRRESTKTAETVSSRIESTSIDHVAGVMNEKDTRTSATNQDDVKKGLEKDTRTFATNQDDVKKGLEKNTRTFATNQNDVQNTQEIHKNEMKRILKASLIHGIPMRNKEVGDNVDDEKRDKIHEDNSDGKHSTNETDEIKVSLDTVKDLDDTTEDKTEAVYPSMDVKHNLAIDISEEFLKAITPTTHDVKREISRTNTAKTINIKRELNNNGIDAANSAPNTIKDNVNDTTSFGGDLIIEISTKPKDQETDDTIVTVNTELITPPVATTTTNENEDTENNKDSVKTTSNNDQSSVVTETTKTTNSVTEPSTCVPSSKQPPKIKDITKLEQHSQQIKLNEIKIKASSDTNIILKTTDILSTVTTHDIPTTVTTHDTSATVQPEVGSTKAYSTGKPQSNKFGRKLLKAYPKIMSQSFTIMERDGKKMKAMMVTSPTVKTSLNEDTTQGSVRQNTSPAFNFMDSVHLKNKPYYSPFKYDVSFDNSILRHLYSGTKPKTRATTKPGSKTVKATEGNERHHTAGVTTTVASSTQTTTTQRKSHLNKRINRPIILNFAYKKPVLGYIRNMNNKGREVPQNNSSQPGTSVRKQDETNNMELLNKSKHPAQSSKKVRIYDSLMTNYLAVISQETPVNTKVNAETSLGRTEEKNTSANANQTHTGRNEQNVSTPSGKLVTTLNSCLDRTFFDLFNLDYEDNEADTSHVTANSQQDESSEVLRELLAIRKPLGESSYQDTEPDRPEETTRLSDRREKDVISDYSKQEKDRNNVKTKVIVEATTKDRQMEVDTENVGNNISQVATHLGYQGNDLGYAEKNQMGHQANDLGYQATHLGYQVNELEYKVNHPTKHVANELKDFVVQSNNLLAYPAMHLSHTTPSSKAPEPTPSEDPQTVPFYSEDDVVSVPDTSPQFTAEFSRQLPAYPKFNAYPFMFGGAARTISADKSWRSGDYRVKPVTEPAKVEAVTEKPADKTAEPWSPRLEERIPPTEAKARVKDLVQSILDKYVKFRPRTVAQRKGRLQFDNSIIRTHAPVPDTDTEEVVPLLPVLAAVAAAEDSSAASSTDALGVDDASTPAGGGLLYKPRARKKEGGAGDEMEGENRSGGGGSTEVPGNGTIAGGGEKEGIGMPLYKTLESLHLLDHFYSAITEVLRTPQHVLNLTEKLVKLF